MFTVHNIICLTYGDLPQTTLVPIFTCIREKLSGFQNLLSVDSRFIVVHLRGDNMDHTGSSSADGSGSAIEPVDILLLQCDHALVNILQNVIFYRKNIIRNDVCNDPGYTTSNKAQSYPQCMAWRQEIPILHAAFALWLKNINGNHKGGRKKIKRRQFRNGCLGNANQHGKP